jgi:Aldehyde dehydrogenase family
MLRILLLGASGPIAWADPIMKDEIFGPIPPILTYKSLDEAFVRIAEGPRPLAAFIFTRSQAATDRFVGELSFGGGAVNQVNIHLFIESMPFGGVGPAGMGHYYGKAGFDIVTHAKSMLISPSDVAIEHLFPHPTRPQRMPISRCGVTTRSWIRFLRSGSADRCLREPNSWMSQFSLNQPSEPRRSSCELTIPWQWELSCPSPPTCRHARRPT